MADWLGEDERYAVINISAGKPANRWMPERFGSLAAELKMPVVLSGGPGDAELAEAVRRSAGDAPTRIACGRFDLRGLVALLRGAALVVSGDSGPMHIANALGTPLVTLFGSSEPKRTGPYLERQTTLLMHRVDCAPCFKMRCPNPPDSFLACLEKISVEEVLAAAGAML